MTIDEAVAAVEATIDTRLLRVDRKRARADDAAFLLIVLDVSRGRGEGPIENGPRLVDRATGRVERLTIPAALERAEAMEPA